MSVAAQSSDTKVTGPVPGPSVLHADVTLNKTAEIPLVSASLLYGQKSANTVTFANLLYSKLKQCKAHFIELLGELFGHNIT